MVHVPVLLEETVARLVTEPGGWYVDGTAGAGGHASALLAAAGLDARLLALDRDGAALALAKDALAPFGDRAILERANFLEMAEAADRHGLRDIRGILLDLGVSSMQLDRPERGFSFLRDSPLDMRMDDRQELTAAGLLQRLSQAELADLLRRYGEEPMSRRIAKTVAAALARGEPIETTAQLAELVSRAKGGRRGRTHPATQTFQALRIAVNGELAALEAVLPLALGLLAPGGRLAVVTFHSLEDRIVKAFFTERAGKTPGGSRHAPPVEAGAPPSFQLLFSGARAPSEAETATNPRARSAKLRVGVRTSAPVWKEAA